MDIAGRLPGLSSFWGPKKLDESHSSMMAQLFSMLYLHFNKHLHNIKSLGFRKESMEAKGDSIEAHKYLLGCVYPEEFITQTLTILRKKNKKKPCSIQVVTITLLLMSSTFQWK